MNSKSLQYNNIANSKLEKLATAQTSLISRALKTLQLIDYIVLNSINRRLKRPEMIS
jgi:hypothetical protein